MLNKKVSRKPPSTSNLVSNFSSPTPPEFPSMTVGEVFSDCTIIELVHSDLEGEPVKLVFWDCAKASIVSRLNHDGRDFVPPTMDEGILKALQLPSHARSYGSTRQLVDDLHAFFGRHPGLQEESLSLLVYCVLSSWFPECTAISPRLSVVAPDASGSALLLRLLRCACRRSLLVSEITDNGILSLPLSLRPTILIDQEQPTRELQRILRAMSRPGVITPRNAQLQEIYCPAVICSAEPLTDPWLLDNCIQVVLTPTRTSLPRIDPHSLSENARELQAKLLQYRLNNFAKVRQSQFDAPELIFPTRDIARTLGACIVDDPKLQSRVIPLLQEQDEDARVRHSMTTKAIVIEAGLLFCHEDKRASAFVGEFATISNAILKGRGEALELEPRGVGDILRSVGLFTRRLGSAGRGILFLNDVRRKIHRSAWAYDVRSIQDGVDRCQFCAEARSRFGDAPKRAT